MSTIERINFELKVYYSLLIYFPLSRILSFLIYKYIAPEEFKIKSVRSAWDRLLGFPNIILLSTLFKSEIYAKVVFILINLVFMLYDTYRLSKVSKKLTILFVVVSSNFIIGGYFILSVCFYFINLTN